MRLISSFFVSLVDISESILKLERLALKDEVLRLELSFKALAAPAKTSALSSY